MTTDHNTNMKIKDKEPSKEKTNSPDNEPTDTKKHTREENSDCSHCAKCNKKLKLTDTKCKCNNYYCSAHRYSDTHECSFDYKKHGREHLKKHNPIINSNKLDKI